MKSLFILDGNHCHRAKILTRSGKFYLSVVAGPGFYSSPRKFVKDCSYEEVEIAIFTIEGDWATKEQASPVFPIIGEGEYNGSTEIPAVFGYVPVELVLKCAEVL